MCGPHGLVGQSDLLYRNQGDGTFADATVQAGITDPSTKYYGLGVVAADYNNDARIDSIEIHWPRRIEGEKTFFQQRIENPLVNRLLQVKEKN